jgi:hypothetical protein
MRKGVSEVVSFVLVLAIMVTATMSAYIWASSSIPTLNEPGRIKNLINQMISLDSVIKSTAHGDINFTTRYEIYYPDGYFELRNTTTNLNSSLMPVLMINQKAVILGYTGSVATTTGCDANYSYDASTHTKMYRYTTIDNVYVGAQGSGPGQAEISICYTNINVTAGSACMRGKNGPFANLNIKKVGVIGTTPQVSIDVC